MKKFYVHEDDTRQGPFDITDLKVKNISRETPVWYEGISEWTAAGKIDELKELFATEPPAFNSTPAQRPQPHHPWLDRRNPLRQRNSKLRWMLLAPVVLLMGITAAMYQHEEKATAIKKEPKEKSKESRKETTNNEESIKRKIRNNIRAYIKAESNTYQSSNLGGISNLKITVSNSTGYTIDMVRVKITYIKANGGIWETRLEDFYAIKPNADVTHKISDTKRGTSIEYEIASIKSKALGLN
jgi:hypothetical protein